MPPARTAPSSTSCPGVNPQGCEVFSFKSPSAEDLDHDFLWRCMKCLPRARPHRHLQPQLLRGDARRCACTRSSWRGRSCRPSSSPRTSGRSASRTSAAFERYLTRNGVVIRKFFLHVSKKEQKRRFLERLENPEKNWKFSANDVKEREFWDDYMTAYEDMIRHTATDGRAVVRRARRQQVVHPRRGRRRHRRDPRLPRPRVSEGLGRRS